MCPYSPDLTWVFMTGSNARILCLTLGRCVMNKGLFKINTIPRKFNIF